MKNLLFLFFAFTALKSFAHGFDENELAIPINDFQIVGSLVTPGHAHGAMPLVIIIAGSAPTDRNCNGQGFKTDAYKKMAQMLALKGIASYRYDKRGIGSSTNPYFKESDLRFTNMVDDAKMIIEYFSKDAKYNQIVIVGHSEGSLVGMMAASEKNKFVSIAGVSTSADVVLQEQLKGKLGDLEGVTFKRIDSLKKGKKVYPDPNLAMIFREDVQPYFISWLKLNPSSEIKKLKNQVLIINGTKDLQVPEKNGTELAKANKNSTLLIIPNMNHCLTEIASDDQAENLSSYNSPELALSKMMMDEIVAFIKK